jgi:DNA invertase Pin-like site-specific DNA recombinase
MSVFGGMSKGERNRVKIRVRTAMAAQAQIEGRFLGGRSPYGYLIVDPGPHPNPAKAADGKRMHKLALDPGAAPVVQRIFAEFLAGRGIFAIAEGLTRDGIPSPSAHDPARKALAARCPELTLRAEAAHQEAFVNIGDGQTDGAEWQLVEQSLHAWSKAADLFARLIREAGA